MIAVVTHLGRQIKCARQTCLSRIEQKLESLVCVSGRAETRVLTHRPKSLTMHSWINSTRVWRSPRHTQKFGRIKIV